jgi:uncharacterized protein YndB with AHSA1/START domain
MASTENNKEALVITRIFDAPRELAWKAWTEPEQAMQWWGPKNFTAPVIKINLRRGGKYLSCMRGPDGKDYWSTGVYREIVPMERIVLTDSFADEKGNTVPASAYGMPGDWPLELLVTVTFENLGGKTKMTLRHEGVPAGALREQCAAGWNQSFDKLAACIVAGDRTRIVAEPGTQEILITRIFDARREEVFRAFTDPNLIPRWWGPKRFTTEIERMDVRPGGSWRFVQTDAGGAYAFHGVYHDVRSPECIVNTFEFEGMPGHVSLETAAFEEIGGRTRVTMRSVYQTVEGRDGMLGAGMEEGVYETMDRLAGLLGKPEAERKAA